MAGSKRRMKAGGKLAQEIKTGGLPNTGIKIGGNPSTGIRVGGNPDSFYSHHPVWRFSGCDVDVKEPWSFYKERMQEEFWIEIFPKLRDFEKMTWGELYLHSKKEHHCIKPEELNKCARDRLYELSIEPEAIYSLRLTGTIRLYGYMVGAVYYILWYDNNHGDNDTCVCRSHLRHT